MSYHTTGSSSPDSAATPSVPSPTTPSQPTIVTSVESTDSAAIGLNPTGSADIFTNPSSDYWVDYPVRATQPTDPSFKLPSKNIGYFQSTIPTTVPNWRAYNPYQGSATTVPSGYDPIGWNCANCYFRLVNSGKNLCTKYRFEIPLGAWRCNSFVTNTAKFTPFVSEQTPFANEDVLQLVDQQGRNLVDIYKFINVDPSGFYPYISGYHNASSSSYVPIFVLGSFRYTPFGSYYDYAPVVRSDWLPFNRYAGIAQGACIPMSLTEKPGWIQYDLDTVSNNFVNLRFLPKDNQSMEFVSVGSAEGFVAMMSKSIVDAFTIGGYASLPYSFSYYFGWQYWFTLYRTSGPKTIFTSGDDLVSGKPVLDAFGEKSVPVSLNPDMFLADGVAPVPVERQSIAISAVSTGLLGIPREEKALNLFEDINRIGLDTTRWVAKTSYQYQSVEPQGWYDSYSVRNNPDLQVPEGALPYETAVRVESDIQNSGINLYCRVPPSSFPWHRYSAYGQTAYDIAKGKWETTNITFPPYGTPRSSGVTSSAELTSRQYFAYQPGRITGFTFGVRVCPPEYVGSSSEVSWGIENDENAIYFRLNNGVWSIVRARFNFFNTFTKRWSAYRSEVVSQGSFNGDNLNGFGDSGYVLRWDTVTMFKIEYGWYGGVGARLYAYIPVGNKATKWVRIHDFGPPQSDSEPNTPADLKNKRYPTLSTPWFKVFYRLVSANGTINDQGMLSISKYGVSVYMDGGNANSPQITDIFGGTKTIPAYDGNARTIVIPGLLNSSGGTSVDQNVVILRSSLIGASSQILSNPSLFEIVFNGGLVASIASAGVATQVNGQILSAVTSANISSLSGTYTLVQSGGTNGAVLISAGQAFLSNPGYGYTNGVATIAGGTSFTITVDPVLACVYIGTWPANANGCPCTIQSTDYGAEKISSSDVFPVIATRYKTKMKKRITADSIAGASTETTNYKVIVPKRLSISATSSSATTSYPLRVDMWSSSGVSDSQATVGKTISYPDGYNYSLSGLFPDSDNSKRLFFKKGSNTPWWTFVPPCYLAPDWSQPSNGTFNLTEEEGNCPTRPTSVDPTRRRYLLAQDSPGVYLRGGLVSGVSTEKDPNFFAMRVAEAGSLGQDPYSSLRDPYFYNLNFTPDTAELAKVGYSLNFKHADMVVMSDPIFDPFFNFSYEATGNVYAGFYYHKSSVTTGKAETIMNSSNWINFLNSELFYGMWPLYFTPYSLHSAYGLFNEDSENRAYTNQEFTATKYTYDSIPSSLKYNTSFTKVVGGLSRGAENTNIIRNGPSNGVHFVFLLAPGASIRNVTISTNPSTNDVEKRAVRFLGQPDSQYAGTSANTVLSKIYGRSLIGTGTQFPARLTNETAYDWLKRIPVLSQSGGFTWGRPGITAQISGSSSRLPATFRDQNENSGILIDTDCTQKLSTNNFQLLGSFFISSDNKKPFSFDLSNFFSYNGTAIRGPGDYTFFVTAKNMTSAENAGLPITVTASVQCEEG